MAVDTIDEKTWFEDYLADVDIDAQTCVTRWEGERIDWPLAIGHLFQRPGTATIGNGANSN